MDTQNIKSWTVSLAEPVYTLLLTGFSWFFLFAFFGFLLAIWACLFLRKRKLLKRCYPAWNIFAKFSYLLIIICLPLVVGAAGAVLQMQKVTHLMLEEDLLPLVESKLPAFNHYLASKVSGYEDKKVYSVRDLIDPMVQELYYQPESSNFFSDTVAKIVNHYILNVAAKALTVALRAVIVDKIYHIGELVKDIDSSAKGYSDPMINTLVDATTRFTIDTSKAVDFTEVTKSLPAVFVDAIKYAIDTYFNSLYLSIGLILLLTFAAIVVEIGIYRYHLRGLENAKERKPNEKI